MVSAHGYTLLCQSEATRRMGPGAEAGTTHRRVVPANAGTQTPDANVPAISFQQLC